MRRVLLFVLLGLIGCGQRSGADTVDGGAPREPSSSPIRLAMADAAPELPEPNPSGARDRCLALRHHVESQPALPGAPTLEAEREEILGRARGFPVVFTRAPRRDLASLAPYLREIGAGLDLPSRALAAIKELRSMLPFGRVAVRSIVLPEGYFFADNPETAEWLVTWFKLESLFEEKEIWMLRGSDLRRLVRTMTGYKFMDGPDEGRDASLLLFDRVAVSKEELLPPLHLDLSGVVQGTGCDRIRLQRMTADHLNAQLRYGPGGPWVAGVIGIEGARTHLECEVTRQEELVRIMSVRAEARERARVVAKLRSAVLLQVDENLPFDEPREEQGQQDGWLRPQWESSYKRGADGYSFNNIPYRVFDLQGRPLPPQVCIDFVLDTFERASGTWYRGRYEYLRERVTGTIDFNGLNMPNRRGVETVVSFFRAQPEMFDVWDLPQEERVPYRERRAFFRYIKEHADEFQPPDVVVIHGMKGTEPHYHSFMVFESDPVTGMPVLLAGNAGRPRLRSWSAVMLSAPLRSIKHRLRPKQAWMRAALSGAPTEIALR